MINPELFVEIHNNFPDLIELEYELYCYID